MTLKPIGPNQTLLDFPAGQILFSYATPVAGFKAGLGYFRTATKYSTTTSRHVNQYLGATVGKVLVVPQSEFDVLVSTIQREA